MDRHTTTAARQRMVEEQIRRRGITDPAVLAAMAQVPRDAFVAPELADRAHDDRPLPIAADQTISQPYVVAWMTAAARLTSDDEVLEIGTGSGYAAAVLSRIARRVLTIERHPALADAARAQLAALGYDNVEVRCGDGTLGWPERAPFAAILATAGGPELPPALLDQLAVGGRLIMPVGSSRLQELVRVTRDGSGGFPREQLGAVRFVPLIGDGGWSAAEAGSRRAVWPRVHLAAPTGVARAHSVTKLIGECAEPIARIDDANVDTLLERIGDACVVLLGEASHGTSEFYRMRTRITQELIRRKGFTAIAVEADWPDAAALDRYIRGVPPTAGARRWTPFARFPTWMWRNREVGALVEWLRAYNRDPRGPQVSFAGLDLYSMYTSASEVVRYLDRVDPAAAREARTRYGRLAPWHDEPTDYGRAALLDPMRSAEADVVAMLRDLLAKRLDGDDFFDAAQNAQLVADAERYYRVMYEGAVESWNLRDQHMFDTLRAIRAHHGDHTKIIVWEHNSHIGNAAATEMAERGEHNLGQLCRLEFGNAAYAVGFGTDHGTVAAADGWDEPMQQMTVRPSRADSYERLCHDTGVPAFMLHLREPKRGELADELAAPRLERAIGVIYRPHQELRSHYFQAVLPAQFDDYIWFDETSAVTELELPPT